MTFRPLALCLEARTGAAILPAFWGYVCVLRSVFVAIFAVCFFDPVMEFRFGNHQFVRKPPFDTCNNVVYFLTGQLSKLDCEIFRSIYVYFYCSALISLLLLARSPTAVLRGIIFIVINPVKRGFWRGWPHVSNKIAIVSPSAADSDAPRAVILKSVHPRVVAAAKHMKPRTIGRRLNKLWFHFLGSIPCASGRRCNYGEPKLQGTF